MTPKKKAIYYISKKELYRLMESIKPFCYLSATEIARESDMSYALVKYVFNGLNFNESIINTIFSHLHDGWEQVVDPEHLHLIMEVRNDIVHEPENGVSAVGVSAP